MTATVLVVDDEASVRSMAARLLESLEYETLEAESAEKALEVLEEASVDLVLTDLKMPGMDGLSFAQKLIREDQDRPVILMTAYADLDSARKAVNIGIYEYYTKPFDVNDLAAGVRRALERRRLVLENREYQKDLERKVEERTRELRRRLAELEARDELLQKLLSIEDPDVTLGRAIQLAADLVGAHGGAIYVPGKEGLVRRTSIGFESSEPAGKDTDVPFEATAEVSQPLQTALAGRRAVYAGDVGSYRQGPGFTSTGIFPLAKGDEVVALLEILRKGEPDIGEIEGEALAGFLPYVAMAFAECRAQEAIPEWEDSVDDMIKAAENWGETE